mgnify:CR=1 FL=1
MNDKTDQLKSEVTNLNCRMKLMCERWEFMDQIVKVRVSCSQNVLSWVSILRQHISQVTLIT